MNISDLFELKNTHNNLRNSDFELPRFETVRFGRNSIKYIGPLIGSKLPRHLRMIETLNSFKVTRPSYFLAVPYPTLKLSSVPTFTLFISLTYSMDK